MIAGTLPARSWTLRSLGSSCGGLRGTGPRPRGCSIATAWKSAGRSPAVLVTATAKQRPSEIRQCASAACASRRRNCVLRSLSIVSATAGWFRASRQDGDRREQSLSRAVPVSRTTVAERGGILEQAQLAEVISGAEPRAAGLRENLRRAAENDVEPVGALRVRHDDVARSELGERRLPCKLAQLPPADTREEAGTSPAPLPSCRHWECVPGRH